MLPHCSQLIAPLESSLANLQSHDIQKWDDNLYQKFAYTQEALKSDKFIVLPCPSDQLWIVTDGSIIENMTLVILWSRSTEYRYPSCSQVVKSVRYPGKTLLMCGDRQPASPHVTSLPLSADSRWVSNILQGMSIIYLWTLPAEMLLTAMHPIAKSPPSFMKLRVPLYAACLSKIS